MKNIIIIIIICTIFYILLYKYYNNIEKFDNDILCQNDCKCMNDDNNNTICGRNDKILGILKCSNCDNQLYNDLCKECNQNINNVKSYSKKKCDNCIFDKLNCYNCTNCIWCNDTNSCIQGYIIGPSDGLKCNNWEYNKEVESDIKLKSTDDKYYDTNFQNILKFDNFLSYSDYNKNIINRENKILNQENTINNNLLNNEFNNNKIYNLSIKKIFTNLSNTIIDIINDLSDLFNNNNITLNKFLNIFIINDRLVYIGVLSIIIAILLYIINIFD